MSFCVKIGKWVWTVFNEHTVVPRATHIHTRTVNVLSTFIFFVLITRNRSCELFIKHFFKSGMRRNISGQYAFDWHRLPKWPEISNGNYFPHHPVINIHKKIRMKWSWCEKTMKLIKEKIHRKMCSTVSHKMCRIKINWYSRTFRE